MCGATSGCTWWHAATECSALREERVAITAALRTGDPHMGSLCDEWGWAKGVMQKGLGQRRGTLPGEGESHGLALRRILAGIVRFGDQGREAARALERLVIVVCRWVWAADRLMHPVMIQEKQAVEGLRCLAVVMRGWRVVVARGGVERVALLRNLGRSWGASVWAFRPVFNMGMAVARARAGVGMERMVTYRGMTLFPGAAKQYGALFRATRDTVVGPVSTCPRSTLDPCWTARQWLMIARLIRVRRKVRRERGGGWGRAGETQAGGEGGAGEGVPIGWAGAGGV